MTQSTPFQFIARAPRRPLDAFVESIWYARGQVPYRQERILPNGRPILIVNLGAPFVTSIGAAASHHRLHRESWIVGTLSRFQTNRPLRETHVVGVTFRPWGAGGVLGLPGCEIFDRSEALDGIWGAGIEGLRQRLAETPGPEQKITVMEAALRSRLAVPEGSGFRTAVAAARRLEAPLAPRIGELCAGLDVSRKHLGSLFNHHIGLSPKAFSRLCRFRHALEALAAETLDLDELALARGYYDQAHFNRDFAAFSGLSPTGYLARRRRFLSAGEDPTGLFVPEGTR